jgi:hypothetical protein
MRVSVFLLRHQGDRIPLDQVRTSTPYEGWIRVSREPGGRVGTWQRGAVLMASPHGDQVLLQLHDVQLQSWDDRGAVLAGTEITWRRKARSAYRQAWLVKDPEGGGTERVTPPGMLELQLDKAPA